MVDRRLRLDLRTTKEAFFCTVAQDLHHRRNSDVEIHGVPASSPGNPCLPRDLSCLARNSASRTEAPHQGGQPTAPARLKTLPRRLLTRAALWGATTQSRTSWGTSRGAAARKTDRFLRHSSTRDLCPSHGVTRTPDGEKGQRTGCVGVSDRVLLAAGARKS